MPEDEKQLPLKTGAFLKIDFAKLFTPECVTVNGETLRDPVSSVSIGFDLNRSPVPMIRIEGHVVPDASSPVPSRFVQVGAFVALSDLAEFLAWKKEDVARREQLTALDGAKPQGH